MNAFNRSDMRPPSQDTEPPLSTERRSEIARRIADHARDPSTAISWDDALATLRDRYEKPSA